jgi:hypothetical protein
MQLVAPRNRLSNCDGTCERDFYPRRVIDGLNRLKNAHGQVAIVGGFNQRSQVLGAGHGRRVSVSFAGVLRGKTVAILGLTFKPNTDDMREVPSIPLIMALQDMGAKVRAFDPVGMEEAKNFLPDVAFC